MRRDEARALGDLAGEAAAGLAGQVRDVHAGVAERVFGALAVLGRAAEPARLIHDGVATGAHAAARALTGGIVRGGAGLFSLTRSADDPSLSESGRGYMALGAINGMWGDRLHQRRSVLETPMAVRRRGRDVGLAPTRWPGRFRMRRRGSPCSSTACARPRTPGSWARAAACPTATGCAETSVTPPSTSATTAAFTSPSTAAGWRGCSTS